MSSAQSPLVLNAGWAPSSVREALYRTAYRGVITWNKSKKRDSSGEAKQTRRPPSEWVSVDAPWLQIVGDKTWIAAHRQLHANRERQRVPAEYKERRSHTS